MGDFHGVFFAQDSAANSKNVSRSTNRIISFQKACATFHAFGWDVQKILKKLDTKLIKCLRFCLDSTFLLRIITVVLFFINYLQRLTLLEKENLAIRQKTDKVVTILPN